MVAKFLDDNSRELKQRDGVGNENGRMPLPPRALARLKDRHEIARECFYFSATECHYHLVLSLA